MSVVKDRIRRQVWLVDGEEVPIPAKEHVQHIVKLTAMSLQTSDPNEKRALNYALSSIAMLREMQHACANNSCPIPERVHVRGQSGSEVTDLPFG